jgi:catalase
VSTSPERALEIIQEEYGAHSGHRALHAKGRFYRGTFTATPRARELTRAAHMTGEPVPATVRFSNGAGDPTQPDYAPDVRGLAVGFNLADGSRHDIVSQTLPTYPFSDQEGFFHALRLRRPSLGTLVRAPLLAIRHPRSLLQLPESQRVMTSRASYVARRYYAFHAYKWVDAGGGERWVRYRWLPTVDEPEPSRAEVKRRGRDYLFDDLAERLGRGAATMRLEVTVAGSGDDPHDPSDEWPDDRERVIVGDLEVTAIDPDPDEGTVFDPMRLVDGIEPSDDPVLRYRPAVYALSHARRTAR